MGIKKKIELLEQQKKKRQKRIIIGVFVSVCIIAIAVVVIIVSQKQKPDTQPSVGGVTPAPTIRLALDSNGDLRVPVDTLENRLNYITYGGKEELIFLKDSNGGIRTAFDTCEECYPGGKVRFTLSGGTLTCSLCGTRQPQSVLGTDSWGGCKPISITPNMRNDTDTEVVIPAGILNYAIDMFAHWDRSDFSVSFGTYGTDAAHTHE